MMFYAILASLCLTAAFGAAQVAEKEVALDAGKDQGARLAGIYVKDGNENGQLRFLASGLTSSSSSTSSNSGLNSALNQYITNKQDMLEQLRPSSSSSATGTATVTGTGTGTSTTSGTGSGVVTTTSNGAIYVNLGNSGSSSSSSSSSSSNAAINQVIYGSSPIADLLPQIVGQAALSTRVRPGQVNRRRVNGGGNRRRRVNKRRGSVNNNNVRRRRRGNKRGRNKNKAQVMVVRPNRG